jgi:methyl-accepting chemotaxis protein
MKKQILYSLIGFAALAASSSQASQEQLAGSIKDAHVQTIQTADQLKSTLGALNQLTAQKKGDLRPAYDVFCTQVTKTKEAAVSTQKQASFMAGDGKNYFQDWQTTVAGISNDSLRKKSQKRLDSAKASYGKVEGSLKQASDEFKPFLSDLEDIQKALSTDITAGGVKSLRGVVRNANYHHEDVAKAIDDARKEMGKMAKSLSSEAK